MHKCIYAYANDVVTSDIISQTPVEKASTFACTVCDKVRGSTNDYLSAIYDPRLGLRKILIRFVSYLQAVVQYIAAL